MSELYVRQALTSSLHVCRRKPLVSQAHDYINPPLAPQRNTELVQTQLDHFSGFVNAREDGEDINLFYDLSRELTLASMRTFYGEVNPFTTKPELVEKYWDWYVKSIHELNTR
jgi:hypothetical protein